jgi:pimeloyl-ACP methyl ester carboxylesterase
MQIGRGVRRGLVLFGIAALLALAGPGLGRASAATPVAAPVACKGGAATSLKCYEVDVPLDRSGALPGTIRLHVEAVAPLGPVRGAIFLIAGGPGQGSAHVFGLDSASSVSFYRYMFPGYTLVAYDDRGTGGSGLLDCPTLQGATSATQEREAAAGCAASLGPARDFYSTADHAEDLEAVREALGLGKIALFGTSYGTKLALAYALAHPDDVERLLLDSVVPTTLPDPFEANVLSALPSRLTAFCADGGCRGATANFPGEVVALANRLAAHPLHGVVPRTGGLRPWTLSGVDFLTLVVDADLNPGLAAELPADVHAALHGNGRPLLRAAILDSGSLGDAADLSVALYAATDCHDGPFPWPADSPVPGRQGLFDAAVAALPPGSLGPFGSWAAHFGNADFCLDWPSPVGGVTLGAGPLPDVPVLAVSGGIDMRTPTGGAQQVIAQFPQGHLLVVPGVGHSVLGADASGCSQGAVRQWILTNAVDVAQCPRPKAFVAPVSAFPALGLAHPKRPAAPAATLAIASKTLQDAEAIWMMTDGSSGPPVAIDGPYGGALVATALESFRLENYSIRPGVTVSGKITITSFGPPVGFQGIVTVSGPAASGGVLGLKGHTLRGTLGGRKVG